MLGEKMPNKERRVVIPQEPPGWKTNWIRWQEVVMEVSLSLGVTKWVEA